MVDFFFYLFAFLILISGLLVATSRNTVNGAMFMIVCFLSTASMFVLLEAYLLAILQVLVYAGAVMVLFLFIIMLIDVEAFSGKKPSTFSLIGSTLSLVILCFATVYIFMGSPEFLSLQAPEVFKEPPIVGGNPLAYTTSSKSFGYGLFTKYILPFEVVGFLLLVAMVGIIVISKKPKNLSK